MSSPQRDAGAPMRDAGYGLSIVLATRNPIAWLRMFA